jgi:hypothetical protein
MAVLTIAVVWVGLSVVAAALFSHLVYFSESAAVDLATSSRLARRGFVLRGGRSAKSRTRIFSRTADHSGSQRRWRDARVAQPYAQPAYRKLG